MRIRKIEAIAVSLPMTRPMKLAGIEIRTADNVIARVECDDGTVGWGEAASAPTMTGETVESMTAAIRFIAPALDGAMLGAPADIGAASGLMDRRMYGNAAAKSAIEMALHDCLGRHLGRPVYELLGGRRRGRVPALWMLASGDTAADVAQAREKKAGGCVAYKIKVGVAGAAADAARTRAICEALGAGNLISADANEGYSTEEAVEYVRAVADTALDFLEQPTRGDDLAGMARVAAASRVPIGADEAVHHLGDLERLKAAGAARGVSLKTIKLGGMRQVAAAGTLCEKLGLKVNLACKIAESSIATAGILHLAAALPDLAWGVSLTHQYLAADVARAPITVAAGHADIPAGPGLGVEVNETLVRRYALKI